MRPAPAIVAVVVMLTLAVLQPVAAQKRLPDDTVIQTAAPGVQAAAPGVQADSQDSFRQRVRDEVADWRSKMRSFDDKVETGSRRHVDTAETRLRAAWDDTEVEARNVQTATSRDWVRTKRAYETASHRMAMAWDKVHF